MRRSRIPKHSRRHIYSRCEVRSCGAVAGARTLGVNFKGRMGAGNPLSPRHADSIRAACKLRSLRNTVRDLRTREAAIHIVAVELVLNQPSSCKDRESALAGRFVCCTLQTCRRQFQNIIQRPKSPLEHREAAERECARAPLIGIRFADGLSAGGYEGVGLGERVARTAKQPQGPARRTPCRVAL